jgi:hypothetical protein
MAMLMMASKISALLYNEAVARGTVERCEVHHRNRLFRLMMHPHHLFCEVDAPVFETARQRRQRQQGAASDPSEGPAPPLPSRLQEEEDAGDAGHCPRRQQAATVCQRTWGLHCKRRSQPSVVATQTSVESDPKGSSAGIGDQEHVTTQQRSPPEAPPNASLNHSAVTPNVGPPVPPLGCGAFRRRFRPPTDATAALPRKPLALCAVSSPSPQMLSPPRHDFPSGRDSCADGATSSGLRPLLSCPKGRLAPLKRPSRIALSLTAAAAAAHGCPEAAGS